PGSFIVSAPVPRRFKFRCAWCVRARAELSGGPMFKAEVKSFEASAPFNRYDSLLEVPSGNNPSQNAWLTLKLRVKLNFADKNNPVPDLTIQKDGKWYAQDWSLDRKSGWLFPLLTWGDAYKDMFRKQFQQHAEKVWNYQFVLITPRTYAELDVTNFDGP